MEEDEEVVLQNSPLDAYLNEVTTQEFSRYQGETITFDELLNQSNNIGSHSEIHQLSPKRNGHSKHLVTNALNLLESNLLNTGDLSSLIDIQDDLKSFDVSDSDVVNLESSYNTPSPPILFGFVVLLVSILAQWFTSNSSYYTNITLFVTLVIVSIIWYGFYAKPTKLLTSTNTVPEFIKLFVDLDKSIDKSLKHIKEVEVINTGLYCHHNPITGENTTAGKSQKCLKLRNVLMDMLIDLFLELRVTLRMLLQTHSDELFMIKEEYIASIPLSKFNDIIAEDQQKDSLTLPTVSLDKLKNLVYLYRSLLSEFVLSLVTCFHSSLIDTDNSSEISHALDHMMSSGRKYPDLLKQVLQKSINLTFHKRKVDPKRDGKTQEDPLDLYFGNCKLNLYSALQRMEEAENFTNDRGQIDVGVLEKVLLEFYMNLDNSRACMEDVLELYKPKKTSSVDPNETKADTNDIPEEDDIVILTSPERELGDLLFEGESVEVPRHYETDDIDVDDLRQQLKEKRESKRLLKELKTIFAVKETPEGLLSFPLAKVSEEEANIDDDEEEDELILRKEIKKKKKVICHEDEDFYGEGEESNERINYLPSAPIGLHVNLLQGLSKVQFTSEETFGGDSSTDDDDGPVVENIPC
ncbi:vezatin-like [Clytia hemisphaerica]|uniref:Vezatin n=1 Tax=Clytia hemisphaerica TaxID=252671 RepID=A0A7M5UPY8_9CNID